MHAYMYCFKTIIVIDEIQHLPAGARHVVTSSQRRQLRTVIIPVERIQLIEILGQGIAIFLLHFYTA